jgi:dTDP-glucose 4,6-dehydratase/UDP-glucose 4-epimerase
MHYLVTGGAGFVGSALVRRLAVDGHEVTVLDDMSRGNPARLEGVGCQVKPGDIRDSYLVKRAMQGCDAVVHLAYLQGTQTFYIESRQVLDVAMRGMLNVLDACEATGCADLLLMSSSEAYQTAPVVPTPEDVPLSVPDVLNPRYSYGGGKIASELLALAWQRLGVLDRVVIARPHNIYGKSGGYEHVIPEFGARIARLVQEHPTGVIPFPVQGTGQETRSFCHITDCIDALALLLDKKTAGGVYHVGTPEEVTIAELVSLIGAHYNRDVKLQPGVLPQGSPPRRCPDISKIRALGYEPKVKLTDGLGPVLDWYRDHPK